MQDRFREAMRGVAATVSVLTTARGTARSGITVSSVMSLTLDPPTICFGLRQASPFCAEMATVGWVCVNVLSRRQEAVARAFATPPAGEHRFTAGDWTTIAAEAPQAGHPPVLLPILSGAQANLICRIDKTLAHGTHHLCVAEVVSVWLAEDVDPLVYCAGAYRACDTPAAIGHNERMHRHQETPHVGG